MASATYRFLKTKKSFLFIYTNKPKTYFSDRDFASFLSVSTLTNFHALTANLGIILSFQMQRDSIKKLTSKSQLFILNCQVMAFRKEVL